MAGFLKVYRDEPFLSDGKPFDRFHALVDLRARASLSLAMEPGKLVIRKGKVPRKRTVKPDGKTFYFRIVNGCRFVVKREE